MLVRVGHGGFSWGPLPAQHCVEATVAGSLRHLSCPAIGRKYESVKIGLGRPLAHLVYVDTVAIVGLHSADADKALCAAEDGLNQKGLVTHDSEKASDDVELLGVRILGAKRWCCSPRNDLRRSEGASGGYSRKIPCAVINLKFYWDICVLRSW